MPWISTIPHAGASDPLRSYYEEVYALTPAEYFADVPALVRADGTTDSIVAAHSLLPEVMRHIFLAMGHLMAPDLPLARRQHEMINTLVSALNRCHY